MKKAVIFLKDSEEVVRDAGEIKTFLEDRGFSVKVLKVSRSPLKGISLRGYTLGVVIGGDGTFLASARIASRFGVPLVGINRGRFGFLTEVSIDEAPRVLETILRGKGRKQKRIMISTYLIRGGKKRYMGEFLNDVVISKSSIARITEIEVSANSRFMVHIYGDGVILATPTGSTAYALSAGGPIVYPDSENLVFVPICPHTLSNRPVVLPSNFSVSFRVLSPDRACFLTMDGQKGTYLMQGDVVEVKRSKRVCKIFLHPEKDYFEILRTKLMWGS